MPPQEPGELCSPDPNVLERRISAYLARATGGGVARSRPPDAAAIRRTTRYAVGLAAAAGIVSGGLIGGSEYWMRQELLNGMEGMSWREQLPYWGAFFAFAGVVSALEIVFLYAVAIRAVARVTADAGLVLGTYGFAGLFALGLARSAHEFPNPRTRVYGVDPYAYVSLWKLFAKSIAYKMKVGVSSFLLRVFLRRIAARMAVRGVVPFVAGPLYAVWNAYIVWRIMGEARIRALAPALVDEVGRRVYDDTGPLSPQASEVSIQGVSEMLRRDRDAHPNHIFLLARLREEAGFERDIEVDWPQQRALLCELPASEQERVLDLLTLAAIIGRSLTRDQKAMLHEACDACGASFSEECLERLRKNLYNARPLNADDLAGVRR